MSDRDWRDPGAYAYVDALPLTGLAWEFLRRNSAFQAAFRRAPDDVSTGWDFGLSAPADPARSADEQPIFWRPKVSPRTLVLATSPANEAEAILFDPTNWPGVLTVRACSDGTHLLLRLGAEEHRLWSAAPPRAGQRLVVTLPLDVHFAVRAEAAARLLERTSKRAPRPPERPSRLLMRRAIAALRALDGRFGGASQRQIAEGVLRARVTGPRAWEDSAARAMTARLLRHGAALVARGYLNLLVRRR